MYRTASVTGRLTLAVFLVAACAGPGRERVHTAEVERILRDDRYEWVTITTGNTRIHFPAGSHAEASRMILPVRAESARSAVLSVLQESAFADAVDLFYVDGRQDMENLAGSPVTGFAYPDANAVVLVFNAGWRAFERHELTHVVTLGKWRSPAGPAVVEGLATFIDGECGGYENARIVRTLYDAGALLPLEVLAGDFRDQDDLVAYLQAAAVIEFVVQRLGSSAIRSLWERGLEAAPGLLGLSAAAFDARLGEWLVAGYEPLPAAAREAIRAGGCGIVALRNG